MIPVIVRPVSMILGKIRRGSWHSSAMFTESSKPTIAKNASDVADGDGQEHALVLGGVERDHPGQVGVAAGNGEHPDQDHQQQAGQLDQGEHDVDLDALADAAEVHRRHQRHETQRDQHDPAVAQIEAEALVQSSRRTPATPSTPR